MQITGVTIGFPMPVARLAKPVWAGFPSPADDFIEEEIDLQRLLIVSSAIIAVIAEPMFRFLPPKFRTFKGRDGSILF